MGRRQTSETKKKISKSLKGRGHDNIKNNCLFCGEGFEVTWKYRRKKFCSVSCSTKYHMKDKSEFYSKLAKKTGLGGNRNKYAHGWYTSPFAGKVYLESSYEYEVAKELDKNKINWKRPKPLDWDGKKYYADFYLVEFNTYLDPKNDFLILRDEEKIEKVKEQNNVNILILTKDELEWDIIKEKLPV